MPTTELTLDGPAGALDLFAFAFALVVLLEAGLAAQTRLAAAAALRRGLVRKGSRTHRARGGIHACFAVCY